jgi:hypothetical protein
MDKSGRADSNRRRPAWEADILPLNYARKVISFWINLYPKPVPCQAFCFWITIQRLCVAYYFVKQSQWRSAIILKAGRLACLSRSAVGAHIYYRAVRFRFQSDIAIRIAGVNTGATDTILNPALTCWIPSA